MNKINKVDFVIKCPRCSFSIQATIKGEYKFFVYSCPKCSSNVVSYKDKVTTISDKFFKFLKKRRGLKQCGEIVPIFEKSSVEDKILDEKITEDKIIDLKILLETETDFNSLISKL